MTYTVTDTHHNLILSLNSKNTSAPVLKVYKNDTEDYESYNPSSASTPSTDGVITYTYTIPLSDFEIGDILTKFTLTQSNSIYPWQTNEGVVILLDGDEVANIHTNTYTITNGFDNAGKHTIQAVYLGNDEYELSSTPKHYFTILQPDVSEQGEPQIDDPYKLVFVNNNLKSTTYDKSTKIKFRLTQGSHPVSGRVVECVNPTTIVSHTTDGKGIVSIDSKNWSAGKYKIGAYFTDDSKIITSVYKTITVNKAPSNITMVAGSFRVGDELHLKVRYNTNQRVPDDSKITLYVNGKSSTQKLDKGDYYYKFDKAKTYEIKVVYGGNSNIKESSFSTTITVEGSS